MNTLLFSSIAVLLGLLAVIPIVLLQLLSFSVASGFAEEAAKALLLTFLPAKKVSHRTFLYGGLLAGISFGIFETIIYVLSGTGFFIRLISAVCIHASCTVLDAQCIYLLKKQRKFTISAVVPLLTAIFLHMIYNYFAVLHGIFLYFSFAVVLASAYSAYKVIKNA